MVVLYFVNLNKFRVPAAWLCDSALHIVFIPMEVAIYTQFIQGL